MAQEYENTYNTGHPWYYVLGGRVLTLHEIRDDAIADGQAGYLQWDIEKADGLTEPKRSSALRKLREKARVNLARDISRYREVVRELCAHRKSTAGQEPAFADIHMAIGLKHSHLSNEFANLHVLDELLSQQRDLFDL